MEISNEGVWKAERRVMSVGGRLRVFLGLLLVVSTSCGIVVDALVDVAEGTFS